MKSCPAGQALNTGKDGKNGKLTKCALVPKLRLSKKLKSNSSAKSAGIENGKSGLTVIATSIVGTHTLQYGAAKLGPSTNVAKGGRSGEERQEEGQHYRTQSFYRGGRRGGKKGDKGSGKGSGT